MIRKYYEDLTFYQSRFTPAQRRAFRDYIQKKAHDLNLKTSIFPERLGTKNIIVGDLKSAKYVICAHYDTTPRLPMIIERNYAFCHLWLELLSLILGGVIGALIMIFLKKYFVLGFIPMALGLYGFLRISGIIPWTRGFSYNDNTSGILTLLNLMSDYKTFKNEVAYVFIDGKEKGLRGSKLLNKMMVEQRMITTKEDKKFFFIDSVGLGRDFAISWYRETKFVWQLKEVFEKFSKKGYSITLKEDSKLDVNDYLSFKRYDHASITCFNDVKETGGYYKSGIKPKRDDHIEEANIEFLAMIIREFIEGRRMQDIPQTNEGRYERK